MIQSMSSKNPSMTSNKTSMNTPSLTALKNTAMFVAAFVKNSDI